MSEDQANPGNDAREMGAFAGFWLLVGLATLGVTAISALNVAFDLNLALGSHGSSTPLPKHWDAVGGLFAAALLIIGLSYFGSAVANRFKEAKGKPALRIGIVAGALALLVAAGRGLQVVALTMTYGSMLAYYCTEDGTLEDVKGELEGATAEELDACIGRTAQWDRHDFLETLFAAGANMKDETSPEEYRGCVLGGWGASAEYIEKAVALGVKPDSCANSEALVLQLVRHANKADDEDIARKVTALLAAGWSPTAKEEESDQLPVEYARENGLERTAAILEAAG